MNLVCEEIFLWLIHDGWVDCNSVQWDFEFLTVIWAFEVKWCLIIDLFSIDKSWLTF